MLSLPLLSPNHPKFLPVAPWVNVPSHWRCLQPLKLPCVPVTPFNSFATLLFLHFGFYGRRIQQHIISNALPLECISFHCNSTDHNEYILDPCRCHWYLRYSILIYVGKWILKVLPRLPLFQKKWGIPCVCAYVFAFMQQRERLVRQKCMPEWELALSWKGTVEVICCA